MRKKVSYKEPAKYFTPSMLKVAEEWEKEHGSGAGAKKGTEKDKKPDTVKKPGKK